MSLTTESQFADIVEVLLKESSSGQASYDDLIAEIPNRITLSQEDLVPSTTRPGEAVWQQRVRNITSHKDTRGNAINSGRFVSIPGGLALPGAVAA
ncbi:hypothetical protein FJN17_16795 [Bradyrhizobium symbiodeficiens]|uniref:Uncharacterized protein n=1 Tax=Bradyrhizobium symbiodeficiens TaxID=1404367 RepID=A0ABX5WA42_9BRAD|nr:hypothetical protein [Bradyrhizobium symbiodeficiens]QDF39077.1 hypothetical protein FJN17_16795 [Bradyrhizobium symbiodeficiens]